MPADLTPCPFCSSAKLVVACDIGPHDLFECQVVCADCGGRGPLQVDDACAVAESEARKEFNRRSQPGTTGKRVVKLPERFREYGGESPSIDPHSDGEWMRTDDVLAALAKAGVEVKS